MHRHELIHLLRAAGKITEATEIYVLGSQAILAWDIEHNEILHRSMEADLAVPGDLGPACDLIEGNLGEGSAFAQHYTYFAEGVVEDVAILPVGWKKRAKRIYEGTEGVTGVCPHPNDLCVAKAIAGREKDWEYIQELHKHTTLDVEAALAGIDSIDNQEVTDKDKERAKSILKAKLEV